MGLVSKVLDLVRREGLVVDGDRVLIGLSGGADSTALFHILRELSSAIGLTLGVAHVNHMLRGAESERDEAFVRGLAEAAGLPWYVVHVDIRAMAASRGLSRQEAGRDARYGFFRSVAEAEGYTKVAVAHTMNDQVETFLLRVVKGTGLKGLASIPLARGNIIRPLLETSRTDIEAYLRQRGIAFVEDSSNESIAYERNFLRHRVIPLLEELNPGLRRAVAGLLGDLVSINRSLEEQVEAFLRFSVRRTADGTIVSIARLRGLSEEARFRIYSSLVLELDGRVLLQRRHGALIEHICSGPAPGALVALPRGLRAMRSYGELRFAKAALRPAVRNTFSVRLGLNPIPDLGIALTISIVEAGREEVRGDGSTALFDADRTGLLSVRTFREGDRFMPLGMTRETKLKDFFMGRKVPRSERRDIPLLLSDGKIIWVVGQRMDERFKVGPATARMLKVVTSHLSNETPEPAGG